MRKQKLYLVKCEVMASNAAEAMTKKGEVYEVQEAAKEYQPDNEKKVEGFTTKK